jgi:hypothetical protein
VTNDRRVAAVIGYVTFRTDARSLTISVFARSTQLFALLKQQKVEHASVYVLSRQLTHLN